MDFQASVLQQALVIGVIGSEWRAVIEDHPRMIDINTAEPPRCPNVLSPEIVTPASAWKKISPTPHWHFATEALFCYKSLEPEPRWLLQIDASKASENITESVSQAPLTVIKLTHVNM